MNTKAWVSESGSATVVQFRNDLKIGEPKVFVHSNIGWIPLNQSINVTDEEAIQMAIELAAGWGLVAACQDQSDWLAGHHCI